MLGIQVDGNDMRECGSCQACCIWPSIKDVKPAGERCQHLSQGNGCTIYETRPEACRDYMCSWIRGHGGEIDKPEISGVLVDRRWIKGKKVFMAKSLRPGATKARKGLKAIERISAGSPVFVLSDKDSNVIERTNTALKAPFRLKDVPDGW
jgi:Fe-S-cluster containining protein